MASVPNGLETLPKILIILVGCTNVTDRRQTDGRRHIANVSSRSLKSITVLFHCVESLLQVCLIRFAILFYTAKAY